MPTVLRRMRRQEIYVAAAVDVWSPADLPNLVGWWDASNAGSITASGGTVSQWNDLSGVGNHITQPSGGAQPGTGTRTINSLNVLDFDGANDRLVFGSNPLTGASAGSLLIVFAVDTDPPSGPTNVGGLLTQLGTAGSSSHHPYSDGNIYDEFGTTVRKTVGNPSSALTTPRVYSVVSAASDWRAYLNGASLFSTGTNTVGWGGAPFLGGGTGGFYWDGRVAEIIMCASGLDTTNRQLAEAYLTTKWGL